MFGWGEFGLVLLLALILLGPDNMVDVARKLGRLYGENTRWPEEGWSWRSCTVSILPMITY